MTEHPASLTQRRKLPSALDHDQFVYVKSGLLAETMATRRFFNICTTLYPL